MGIKITGVGKSLPPKAVDNKEFEKYLETSDEWITTRTGIKTRYIAEKEVSASDLAFKACEEAIKNASLKKEDIDGILVSTVTPDYLFPSTACMLQKKLGLRDVFAFDFLAGCTGFVYGIEIANNFIKSGNYRNILVVSVELLSRITDFEDRNTAVLFGDGAGAVVVSKIEESEGILSTFIAASGKQWDKLIMPAGGSVKPASVESVKNKEHFIKMDGRAVFKEAVNTMIDSTKRVLEKANLTKDDIDLYIPHQANKRIIDAIANFFEIDSNKVYVTVDKYANISSATIPVAIYDAMKEGKIKKGSKVVLTAFGAGFTWGAALLQF